MRQRIQLSIVAIAVSLAGAQALAVNDLRLNVASGSTSVAPGDTVTVTLDVSNLLGSQINGVQVFLNYDTAVMTLTSIAPSVDLLGNGPATTDDWGEGLETDVAGDISYIVGMFGGSITIDHTVATLTFSVIAEGSTTVTFQAIPTVPHKLTLSNNSVLTPTTANSGVITSACDDGLICTVDTFNVVAGQCVFTPTPLTCAIAGACFNNNDLNPVNDCQSCNSATTQTNWSNLAAATACGSPIDTICDNPDTCDGAGACNLNVEPSNFLCDDGNDCTSSTAVAGAVDTCDGAGLCNIQFVVSGGACDDGLACNVGETCQTGACIGGAPPICTGTGDQCNADSTCNSAGAEGNCDTAGATINEGLACDDLLFCTVGDLCTVGACGGGPRDCSASGDQCNSGACNETTNLCEAQPITNGTPCDLDANVCTVDLCDGAGACLFDSDTSSITVSLEIEALSPITPPVTRDVAFIITDCAGSVDVLPPVPVVFDAFGQGTAVLTGVNTSATWISAKEGHTLNGTLALDFAGTCSAAPAFTGVSQLLAGDWHNLDTAPQDGLVDVVDFSILASEWGVDILPNASDGADTTGDGHQDAADFTALVVNFLKTDVPVDSCPVGASGGLGRFDGPITTVLMPQRRISVEALSFFVGEQADLNRDGVVDALDIQEFARRHNLPLPREFTRNLETSLKQNRGLRGSRR